MSSITNGKLMLEVKSHPGHGITVHVTSVSWKRIPTVFHLTSTDIYDQGIMHGRNLFSGPQPIN